MVMGAIAVVALAWWLAARLRPGETPVAPAVANGRWLLVHGATLTLVSDPALPKPVLREAACVKLPPAALYVTERDDEILMLDPQNPSLLFLSRQWLRQVAAG